MMLRLLVVLAVLFVTQISTRLMEMPLAMVGSDCMLRSYCWRKKWFRKKWRFSS